MENFETGGSATPSMYGTQWLCQLFTASDSYNLTSVDLYLTNSVTVYSGDVTVDIHAVAGGEPTGAALATATVAGSLLPQWSFSWIEFVLSVGIDVVAGTQYAIVLSMPGATAGQSSGISENSTNDWSPDLNGDSADSGSTWVMRALGTMFFRTYSTPPDTTVYTCGQDIGGSKNVWQISISGAGVPTVAAGWNIGTGLPIIQAIVARGGGLEIFCGGDDGKVVKIDDSGAVDTSWATSGVWTGPGKVRGVAVNSAGELVLGYEPGGATVQKLTAAGTLDWAQNYGTYGFRPTLLSNGDILMGFADTLSQVGRKLECDTGTSLATYGSTEALAVYCEKVIANSAETSVFLSATDGKDWAGTAAFVKHPIDGLTIDYEGTFAAQTKLQDLLFHSSGRLFACGGRFAYSGDECVCEIDPDDGTRLNKYNTGSNAHALVEDANGYIIACGQYDGGDDGENSHFRVFDVDLNLLGYITLGDSGFPDSNLYALSSATAAPPEITDQTASPVEIDYNHVLALFVTASGDGTLLYQWSKDGVDIVGANLTTYDVTNAVDATAGTYLCTVSTDFGSVESTSIVVTVIPRTEKVFRMFDLDLDLDHEDRES